MNALHINKKRLKKFIIRAVICSIFEFLFQGLSKFIPPICCSGVLVCIDMKVRYVICVYNVAVEQIGQRSLQPDFIGIVEITLLILFTVKDAVKKLFLTNHYPKFITPIQRTNKFPLILVGKERSFQLGVSRIFV